MVFYILLHVVLRFWTLTANYEAYRHRDALELAKSKNLSPEGLFYAFCMTIGISPMDGTTNLKHMKEDIDLLHRIQSGELIFDSIEELAIIGNALATPDAWQNTHDLEDEEEL